jgi:phosphoenolpyruvate synthase/pyruvate phosphate dikinase
LKVALSVGVTPMARSDLALSAVIFTVDKESGFRDLVTFTGAYGLSEFVFKALSRRTNGLSSSPLCARDSTPLSEEGWDRRK